MGGPKDTTPPPTIGRKARAAAGGLDVPEVPELRDAVSAARASTNGPMQDKVGADGDGPERSFTLDYLDKRGRRWVGDFTMRVLTMRDTIQLGLIKARLAGGVPLTHLDPDTALTLEVIAHLSVALTAAPPWAKDLLALYDAGVVGAIYEEVAKYEARFREAVPGQSGDVDGDGT